MNMKQPIPQAWHALALGFITSCAQVEPKPDFDNARHLIEASTGRGEVFDPSAAPLSTEESC